MDFGFRALLSFWVLGECLGFIRVRSHQHVLLATCAGKCHNAIQEKVELDYKLACVVYHTHTHQSNCLQSSHVFCHWAIETRVIESKPRPSQPRDLLFLNRFCRCSMTKVALRILAASVLPNFKKAFGSCCHHIYFDQFGAASYLRFSQPSAADTAH